MLVTYFKFVWFYRNMDSSTPLTSLHLVTYPYLIEVVQKSSWLAEIGQYESNENMVAVQPYRILGMVTILFHHLLICPQSHSMHVSTFRGPRQPMLFKVPISSTASVYARQPRNCTHEVPKGHVLWRTICAISSWNCSAFNCADIVSCSMSEIDILT